MNLFIKLPDLNSILKQILVELFSILPVSNSQTFNQCPPLTLISNSNFKKIIRVPNLYGNSNLRLDLNRPIKSESIQLEVKCTTSLICASKLRSGSKVKIYVIRWYEFPIIHFWLPGPATLFLRLAFASLSGKTSSTLRAALECDHGCHLRRCKRHLGPDQIDPLRSSLSLSLSLKSFTGILSLTHLLTPTITVNAVSDDQMSM